MPLSPFELAVLAALLLLFLGPRLLPTWGRALGTAISHLRHHDD